MNKNTIIKYIRDRTGKKIGMFVGIETPYYVREEGLLDMVGRSQLRVDIGWSLCHQGDKFDAESGSLRCIDNLGKPVPPSILREAKKFRIQCFDHFEDAFHIQKIEVMEYQKQTKKIKVAKPAHNGGHRPGCSKTSCKCEAIAKVFHEGKYLDLKAASRGEVKWVKSSLSEHADEMTILVESHSKRQAVEHAVGIYDIKGE